MKRHRRHVLSWLTDKAIALSPNRMDEAERTRRRDRFNFAANVARWPLRMTEFLRDRLRTKWLTLRR